MLFIGNSFTARNDLPGLLARLVEAAGKGVLESEVNVQARVEALKQSLREQDDGVIACCSLQGPMATSFARKKACRNPFEW